ncbi:MAG: zinc ribbon domain-containing protein [Clostridia bacterium]|nr:zinc ribbon domain-containing protein [Clostridia bacterium]
MNNDFINDVADKAKCAAEYAGKKVGVAVDFAKLKIKVLEIKNAIEKTYIEIGKLSYGGEKKGVDNSEKIASRHARLDELFKELHGIEADIASVKGKDVCARCGKANADNASYCSGCGADLKG